MASPSKAKGDKFEIAITGHCAASGVDARRTRAGYEHDYGDVHLGTRPGRPPFAILQAKNEARIDLAGYVRAAEEQRVAAGAEHGAAVVKRKGVTDPGRQYVVMTLDDYLRLLTAAGCASVPTEEGDTAA